MKPLNVGRLNRRITFMKAAEGQDNMQQTTQEWKPYKTVWATVKALRGTEGYEAQKIQSQQVYKITTRYHEDITPDMRVKYNGKIFEITSVNNVEEADYMLEMDCIEYIEKKERVYGNDEFEPGWNG